jgi:hypothetical protein
MSNCPFCGAEEIKQNHVGVMWKCLSSQRMATGSTDGPQQSQTCRIRELGLKIEAIRKHWEFGVDEDTEKLSPWHQKMRELLSKGLN